jgi:thiamine biosynthesis protein ThiS
MLVNGKQIPLPSGDGVTTLEGFLETIGYNTACIAVEKNGLIANKNSAVFRSEPLRDDDVLEIVNIVGGG